MGTSGVAATETSKDTRGMSHSGRKYAFTVPVRTQGPDDANGRNLPGTGRLENNYLIIN